MILPDNGGQNIFITSQDIEAHVATYNAIVKAQNELSAAKREAILEARRIQKAVHKAIYHG